MTRLRRTAASARAFSLAAALLLAPGCTQWDDWLPGTPFTPDQPAGAVTLTGSMNSDPITAAKEGCTPGGTLFWGTVTNTGDVPVIYVSIAISAFDGAGALLGTWSGDVYNGEVEEVVDADTNEVITVVVGTSLDVEQSGTFNVCTPVPFGAAARTEHLTSFTEAEGTE